MYCIHDCKGICIASPFFGNECDNRQDCPYREKFPFESGDIIEHLRMAESNPYRKALFIRTRKDDYLVFLKEDEVMIRPLEKSEMRAMTKDTQYYVVTGHCDVKRFLKKILKDD